MEKEKIFADYKTAQKNVERVFFRKSNFFVKSIKQYLSPTIVCKVCDIEDQHGEFLYYQTIRNTLEKILTTGQGIFTWHFNGAPNYIKDLLKKEY